MKRLLISLCGVLAAYPAYAVDKIYSPYVRQGEWEMEYFGRRSFDGDRSRNNAQQHEISAAYSPTGWWKTELTGIFPKAPQDSMALRAVEWENLFQFTRPGDYWIDAGAQIAYEWTPDERIADAIEVKLLFAKKIGQTFHVLNISGEQAVMNHTGDSFEASTAWSSRYRYSPYFQPGFELHNEFGEVNDISSFQEQEHYIGPVIYGKLPFQSEGEKIEGLDYRVGYVFGFGNNSSHGQFLIQLEYELE